MLLMNELQEFVDPEPGCAYPSLANIKPRKAIEGHEKASYQKKCPSCGRVFRAVHKSKVYCCESCRTSAYRKRKAGL